jgi:deoxyribodipyrimidine photolyase-related protein
MSYYPKNQGWSKLWDALYWRFMFRYSDRFATNPRMKMQRSLLEKMSPNVLREHCNVGDEFIQRLSEF